MSPGGFARLTPHILSWIKNIAGLKKVQGFECLDGWKYNSDTRKCYKYFEKNTSWSNARYDCQSMFTRGISSRLPRGTLAIITNEEDVKLVSMNDKNIKTSQFWLGGRKTEGGKWVWLDGTELDVGKWAQNQPDNYRQISDGRLSWFSRDADVRKRIFVPDNLSEGKEETRVLPWVFHSDETKAIELKCLMRGYNVSNNPVDYHHARFSYPGFDDSQVDTSAPAVLGEESGVPYAIWTIEITISAQDAGKKWATCEWQQGDFPMSIDFKFLIFSKLSSSTEAEEEMLSYGLREHLDEKDITRQVDNNIKTQISKNYSVPASKVSRSDDGQRFLISVNVELLRIRRNSENDIVSTKKDDLIQEEDKLTMVKWVKNKSWKRGKWNNAPNIYHLGFVCQYFVSKIGLPCLPGWILNSDATKCYKYSDFETTWLAAKAECESPISPHIPNQHRAHLVSIANKEENGFVSSLVQGKMAWLGGTKLVDGIWLWIDGSVWLYENWRLNSEGLHMENYHYNYNSLPGHEL